MKNEPKTNPIRTQFKPNPFKDKINATFCVAKVYENKPPLRAPGKRTQNEPNSNPIKPNSCSPKAPTLPNHPQPKSNPSAVHSRADFLANAAGFCIIASMSLEDDIKRKALELGFDVVGITDASPVDAEQAQYLSAWLKAGYAGKMDYMHRNFEKRIDPAKLLQNAQSVIVLGLNYKPPQKEPKPADATGPTGKVANYARYEDYHQFIKKRLRKLAGFIVSIAGEDVQFKICVDSAPLAERALALRAGLGFIGKNHILIHPVFGPQIFLAEIVTTLKLEPDKPTAGDCSGCNKCIDACPTGALRADGAPQAGQFDANKCISYLTIEHKGPIPAELAERIGDRLFGCDECVLACPYQKDAPTYSNKQLKFYPDRAQLALIEVLTLDEESFNAKFTDSPLKRSGLETLKRNARICLANITSH